MLHRLETLPPGTRFRYPDCGKIGTVVSHGQMGSRVRFESSDKVITIAADEFKGRPARTFTVSGGTVDIVSSGSEVMLWPAVQSPSTPLSAERWTATPRASDVVMQPALAALPSSRGTTDGVTNESAMTAKRTTRKLLATAPLPTRGLRPSAGGSGTRVPAKSSARYGRRRRTRR